jgi:hypothetical protein
MMVGLTSVLECMEKGCRVSGAGSWSRTFLECEAQTNDGMTCQSPINMTDVINQKKKSSVHMNLTVEHHPFEQWAILMVSILVIAVSTELGLPVPTCEKYAKRTHDALLSYFITCDCSRRMRGWVQLRDENFCARACGVSMSCWRSP